MPVGVQERLLIELERLKKYRGRLEMKRESGLFGFWLRFDSVAGLSADSTIEEMHRDAGAMLLRRSLAKTQKSSLQTATVFL